MLSVCVYIYIYIYNLYTHVSGVAVITDVQVKTLSIQYVYEYLKTDICITQHRDLDSKGNACRSNFGVTNKSYTAL